MSLHTPANHSSMLLNCVALSDNNDLSRVEIALFVGCYTGNGGNGGNNLPTKTVECGARVAIGFVDSINCNSANYWTEHFYDFLLDGETASRANDYANWRTGLSTTFCGDGTYCLP